MTSSEKNTRQSILEATKLLLAEGKGNISMSGIAKKCGVTKSALYYFFQNKKDLITAVMQSLPAERNRVLQKIAEEDLPADKKLTKMITHMLQDMQKEHGISQYIFRQIFANDADLFAMLVEERNKVLMTFQEIVSEGAQKGIFQEKDPGKSAQIILGFLDFLGLCFTIPDPTGKKECPWNPKELCDHLLSLLKK